MLARCFSTIFVISLLLTACSPAPQSGTPAGPSAGKFVLTGDETADWAQVVALEDQAKAIVKSGGCSSASQCRTAPVGSRACGGPRYYLVYCAATTDSVALYQKLDAVAAAEREFNSHYKIMSTCEFRLPPKVALSGGSCQAQEAP